MYRRGSTSSDTLILMYPQGQDQNPYAPQNQQQQNPYAPPVAGAWNEPNLYEESVPQGTYWGGFAAGIIFALIGLIVVYVVGKEETKRGAVHGFGIRIGLSLLVVLATLGS
jgi:hypothetical protein